MVPEDVPTRSPGPQAPDDRALYSAALAEYSADDLVRGQRGDVKLWIVDHGCVLGNATCTAIISNRRITGLSAAVIAELSYDVDTLR